MAKISFRINKNKCSSITRDFALLAGQTALHMAAVRNDIEFVEILLSAGADPSEKNDLGYDSASLCECFPELSGLLKKRVRKMKLIRNALRSKRIVYVVFELEIFTFSCFYYGTQITRMSLVLIPQENHSKINHTRL